MSDRITAEQAYQMLVKERHRDNPKTFAVYAGSTEEKLAKKLHDLGFFELSRHLRKNKGQNKRIMSVYNLVSTPHNPPKLQ